MSITEIEPETFSDEDLNTALDTWTEELESHDNDHRCKIRVVEHSPYGTREIARCPEKGIHKVQVRCPKCGWLETGWVCSPHLFMMMVETNSISCRICFFTCEVL